MKKTMKTKKLSKKKQLKQIEKHLPKAYRPITGWGYFFRGLLYIIPVLGWIVAWSKAARAKNRNVSNYARLWGTYAVLSILAVVAVVALWYFNVYNVEELVPFIKLNDWLAFLK